MGWRSTLRHIRAEGRKQDKKIRREERKIAKEEQIIERRENRGERRERKEELTEKRNYIKTKGLPPPYIGEIRYGRDIPHKHEDNYHKFIYKHCAQTGKYEWVEINKLIKLYIKSKRGKTIKLVGYDGGVIKELAENEYINSQIRKKNLRR